LIHNWEKKIQEKTRLTRSEIVKLIIVVDHEENEDCRSGPKEFIDSGNRGRRRKNLMKILKRVIVKEDGPRSLYVVKSREELSIKS
jgi:hypothetical protein